MASENKSEKTNVRPANNNGTENVNEFPDPNRK